MRNGYIIGITALVVGGCAGEAPQTPPRVAEVVAVSVSATKGGTNAAFPGTIEPATKTVCSFSVPGTLTSVEVKVGERVHKGQLLATLDATQLKNAHDIALATLGQAQDAYNRMKDLHEQQALPDIKWVEVQSKLRQAEGSEQLARKQLNDSKLYAPYEGSVARKLVEVGQTLTPAQPVLEVMGEGRLRADISVPENRIGDVALGQGALCSCAALPGKSFSARVDEVALDANSLTHAYNVKLVVEGQPADLRPGMTCSVELYSRAAAGATNAFIVPYTSLLLSPDNRYFCWLKREGRAHRVFVVTGPLMEEGILVTSGLAAGDSLIVEGTQKVSEGTLVKDKQ